VLAAFVAGPLCTVLIERKAPPQSGQQLIINLGEMRLFNAAGVQIPSNRLSVWASSVHPNFQLRDLTDGNENTLLHSDFEKDFTNPSLRLSYPCAEGLSRVEVVNRRDCCSDRINAFQMRFLDAAGADLSPAFTFSGVLPNYTATPAVPAGRWMQLFVLCVCCTTSANRVYLTN
jgi:hypothetical protein